MVIFVIDSSEEPGKGDEYILNFLIANKTEFIVALNKWDLVNREFRNLRLDQYRRFFGINRSTFSLYCFGSIEIIKLTANTNINLKRPEPRFPAILIKFLKLSWIAFAIVETSGMVTTLFIKLNMSITFSDCSP